MSSEIKNVMVIGAGSFLGSSVLSAFSGDSRFTVSVLSRASSTTTLSLGFRVYRIADNYSSTELVKAFEGQDAVINIAGPRIQDGQFAIIDAVVKAGVKRYIPPDFGGDTQNEKTNALIQQRVKWKVDTVKYLKSKEKDGLTWSSFITGYFIDLGLKKGYIGFDLQGKKATIIGEGNVPWSTTTRASIGIAIKNALLNPEKTANKYLYINSFTVSQNQVLESLEKATGEKWDVTRIDGEDRKAVGLDKAAKGEMVGLLMLTQYATFTDGYGGNYAQYRENANELLGVPKVDLDEVVREVVNI